MSLAWAADAEQESIDNVFQDDGVRIEILRDGDRQAPFFLLPGLGDEAPDTLRPLAQTIASSQAIIALLPPARDASGRPIETIERQAELLVSALRSIQSSGPYRIGGYSFGGLVVFEMAHQLRSAGETIEPIILIDPVFDERFWPRQFLYKALLRRTFWRLRSIAALPAREAVNELRVRATRLGHRLRRRVKPNDEVIVLHKRGLSPLADNSLKAMSRYRPQYYDDKITLVCSKVDRHYGCRTSEMWAGLAACVETVHAPGDHLSIWKDAASLKFIAEVIDGRLEINERETQRLHPSPGFSRPMLFSTMRWLSSARIAHSLVESGFHVTACRPSDHPLNLVEGLCGQYRFTWLSPIRSLRDAIAKAEPDIILPDDERAIQLLHLLYLRVADEDPALAALISRSIGGVEFKDLSSRTGTIAAARELGIACPKTELISAPESLSEWPPPFMLKTDGSWGGQGVVRMSRRDQIPAVWRALSRPSLLRAIKRLLVDRDAGAVAWLSRQTPAINAQACVETEKHAMATAACNDGQVLSLVCLEILQSQAPQGPATVVQVIDHPGMTDAIQRIAQRFRLSGFFGIDFLIDAEGVAQLIEINYRITPTCHFLVEQLSEGPIALFPQEQIRDAQSTIRTDIPRRAPALVEFARSRIPAQGRN